MKIHSIFASDEKWGIALGDYMPWKFEREYEYFTRMTTDTGPGRKNVLVMGRNTWMEVTDDGPVHPLPNRYSFILSKTLKEVPKGASGVVASVEELVELLESPEWKDKIGLVFNCGGSQTFKYIHDSNFCGRIYATRIKKDFHCDVFGPVIENDPRFKRVAKSEPYEDAIPDGIQSENGCEWEVHIYEKISQQ